MQKSKQYHIHLHNICKLHNKKISQENYIKKEKNKVDQEPTFLQAMAMNLVEELPSLVPQNPKSL